MNGEDPNSSSEPPSSPSGPAVPVPGPPLVGLRTGLVLYTLLLGASAVFLKGSARILCLLIVGALLVKSVIFYLRSRLE